MRFASFSVLFASLCCLVVTLGCGGKLGSQVVYRNKMLYVAKENDNRIHCFDLEIDPNEQEEDEPEKWPVYRVSTLAPILHLALSPNLKWLFALNDLGDVEVFESRYSGRLNRLAPPTVSEVKAVAIAPNSSAVFFASESGSVFGFSIDSAGTMVSGTPTGVPGPANPRAAVIRPDGKALYVSDSTNSKIWQYAIQAGGVLQPLSPASVDVSGGPASMIWDSQNSRLYVSCTSANQIAQFATVTGGQITETSRVAGPGMPGMLALDSTNSYLFVPSTDGSKQIGRYQVGVVLSPLSPRGTNHTAQVEARLEENSGHLFILNTSGDSFSKFRIMEDGSLNLLETTQLLSNPVASAYRRLP